MCVRVYVRTGDMYKKVWEHEMMLIHVRGFIVIYLLLRKVLCQEQQFWPFSPRVVLIAPMERPQCQSKR